MTTRGGRPGGSGARGAYAAAALGLLLAAGGCASRFVPSYKPFYVVNVIFKGPCAFDVDTQERNCDASRPQRCLRARRGERVTFQAVDAEGRPSRNDFEIRFGPFKETAVASAAGATRPLVIDGPPNPYKAYPFNVYTTGQAECGVVDPQIIIER